MQNRHKALLFTETTVMIAGIICDFILKTIPARDIGSGRSSSGNSTSARQSGASSPSNTSSSTVSPLPGGDEDIFFWISLPSILFSDVHGICVKGKIIIPPVSSVLLTCKSKYSHYLLCVYAQQGSVCRGTPVLCDGKEGLP